PLDQIKRVSDVMAKGFTSSNTNLLELGEAMKYVAPIAEAAGASIEDTTALLGVLADNGIKGSMAGTSTSSVFSRLQAPVAAIVAGGLLIRKYWEPISAFIAGVAEGFTAAMGPISTAFEPLKPMFNWFSDKVKQLSNWFADLIKPVKAT
ncbi:phage tail tape measure protein, partial [Yersinia enterocolitica]|uniref:phage tail tape measure protein n=1 Tax=Yersinia enterocolitica TaxID=630 RepID=UPI000518FA17